MDLNTHGMKVWPSSVWISIGEKGGPLWKGLWTLGFCSRWRT